MDTSYMDAIQILSQRVSSLELTATQPTDGQSPVNTGHFSGQSPVLPQGMASTEQTNVQSRVDTEAWADRPSDELPDYDEIIVWSSDESEDERNLKELSETTAKIPRDYFVSTMPNEKRRDVERKRPVPDSTDPFISSKLSKRAKDADREPSSSTNISPRGVKRKQPLPDSTDPFISSKLSKRAKDADREPSASTNISHRGVKRKQPLPDSTDPFISSNLSKRAKDADPEPSSSTNISPGCS